MATRVDTARKPFTYLSLGGGVQSTALLTMAALGDARCPRPDLVVFADTQDEPRWVYDHLRGLSAWAAGYGLPVVTVTAGRLSDEARQHAQGTRKRRASMPFFTRGADGRAVPLPRQCTHEYKIAPIQRAVRVAMGVGPRQHLRDQAARCLLGLSYEEVYRVKPARVRWIVNAYPLIQAVMRRIDCVRYLESHGLPVPRKSACVQCPYHDDAYWEDLRRLEPHSFADACALDEIIRDSSLAGLKSPVYLHRSLLPLREVVFQPKQHGELFGNECEGVCGV